MPEILSSDRVQSIFLDCLFRDGEEIKNQVEAEGILHRAWFHPARLAEHREEVAAMLMELPREFRQSAGGGWSFLNACLDQYGHQWTGLHKVQEELFLLGLALKLVACPLPRTMWGSLPGGMPYYIVLDRTRAEYGAVQPTTKEHQ